MTKITPEYIVEQLQKDRKNRDTLWEYDDERLEKIADDTFEYDILIYQHIEEDWYDSEA